MGKNLKVLANILLFCLLSQGAWALVFTAKDRAFTIDLPSTWAKVQSSDYLSLKNKDGATMRFVRIENCFDRQCLEAIVEKEIKDLTKRNFKIIKNDYTGDIVRETEFSTKDPLFSFDFTKQDMLFTAGYFLSGGKAYNVGVRNVPATEAAYLLSFVSPVPQDQQEESLDEDLDYNQAAKLAEVDQSDLLIKPQENKTQEKPKIQAKQKETVEQPDLSRKTFNLIILIIASYLLLWGGAFVYKLLFPSKPMHGNTNPSSPYPLQGKRLYGSPDLFVRLHDNLGNHYIATSSRWGALFAFCGLMIALIFTLARFAFALIASKNTHTALMINTLYSLSYLFSACGFIVFVFGVILNLLFPYKYLFYSSEGELKYKCVQKGLFLLKEQYFIATQEGQIICKLIRKSFSPLRTWQIFDADKEIAKIKERSILKALLRRLLGHLFGFLRADYLIQAQMDSFGEITSISKVPAQFNLFIDKPQALPEDIMLVFTAVLFMRDRDKSFPWIN